jgi:hypothetical protein
MELFPWMEYVDTQQFFATIAQVIPVLLLALVLEKSVLARWVQRTDRRLTKRGADPVRHRRRTLFLAVSGEVIALAGILYKAPDDPEPPDDFGSFFLWRFAVAFLMIYAASVCLILVVRLLWALLNALYEEVGTGTVGLVEKGSKPDVPINGDADQLSTVDVDHDDAAENRQG